MASSKKHSVEWWVSPTLINWAQIVSELALKKLNRFALTMKTETKKLPKTITNGCPLFRILAFIFVKFNEFDQFSVIR